MIEIEVRGITCLFNDGALDDFEMLEKLEKMDNGDVTAMVSFARGIFGEEQLANIKDSLRDEGGVCHLSDMSEFIGECMQAASEQKRVDLKN